MRSKNLEFHYDIAAIPGISDRSDLSLEAVAFRNAAMAHVEAALAAEGLGEWEGSEIGGGEVSFGFMVDDFDVAEAFARAAVAGTQFECIREIERHEFAEEDLQADITMQEDGRIPLAVKLAIVVSIPLAILIFAVRLATLPIRAIARRG